MSDTTREVVARAIEALETCLHRISRSNIRDFDTMHPDNCPQEARLALSHAAAIRAAIAAKEPASEPAPAPASAPSCCGELSREDHLKQASQWLHETRGWENSAGAVVSLLASYAAARAQPCQCGELRKSLELISLGSQNSGTTKEDLGREARKTLAATAPRSGES